MPSGEPVQGERRLGPYLVTGRLGQGGMGTVYEARRADLPQLLAVKVLHSARRRSSERFAREQEILARLDHPAVVRFIDSGVTAEGAPYYVMERVDGLPIDRYCAEQGLDLDGKIALFLEVCAAVQHAHQHLVVHRDLKPSNILVDREGRPRLLDFGIAKWLDLEAGGQETTRGAEPMTLLYASPEQLRGAVLGVNTDVYSLTVVLFELVTGGLPYPADADMMGLALAIAGEPKLAASEVLARRGEKALARQVRGDLDAVLAKGLASDPGRRYQGIAALMADLRNYREHRPVAARGHRLGNAISLFARRHQLESAAALVLALLVIATAGLLKGKAVVLEQEKQRAEAARLAAAAQVDLLGQIFAEGDLLGGGPLATLEGALDAATLEIGKDLAMGRATGPAMAATAVEAFWHMSATRKAVLLAQQALASRAVKSPRELGRFFAVLVAANSRLGGREWERFRQELLRIPGQNACAAGAETESAMVALGASSFDRSRAVEVEAACALERGRPGEAAALWNRVFRLRQQPASAAPAAPGAAAEPGTHPTEWPATEDFP